MDRLSQPATPLNAKSMTNGANQYRHPYRHPQTPVPTGDATENGANTSQVSAAGQAPDTPLHGQMLAAHVNLGGQDYASALATSSLESNDRDSFPEQAHNFAPTRNPYEYTVVRGDNLWKIARRDLQSQGLDASAPSIMMRIKEIIEANKDKYPELANAPNLVRDGWKLRIPADNRTDETSANRLLPEEPFDYWQCVANRL